MKTHLVALAIGISLLSHGASVQWNCMKITCAEGVDRISVGTYDFAYSHEIWPEIGIEISTMQTFVLLTATDMVVPEFLGNWVVSSPGNIVNETTTRHLNNYLYHAYIDNTYQNTGQPAVIGTDDGPLVSGGSVSIRKDSDVYLAFAVESMGIIEGKEPEIYYGWLQLLVGTDGQVSVGASAIDLDGGPMIVGGGSAIPEPSTALLLFVGGALLALRRRRKMT